MKIGINLLHLSDNANSSITKQADRLLNGFAKIGILENCCLFVKESSYARLYAMYPDAQLVTVSPNAFPRLILKHKKVRLSFYEGLHLNKHPFSKAVQNAKPDLMLYPFNDSTCHLVKGIPNFMIFQDMTYLNHPEYYGRLLTFYAKRKQAYFIKNCQQIITVSEFVKQQLHENIPAALEKPITVIPNAITVPSLFAEYLPIDGPYLLSVGALSKQKNLLTVVRAFSLIHRRIPHNLILIGHKRDEADQIITYIKEHNLSDRILLMDNIPEANQNSLLRHASLLIHPSLYESFGQIPIQAALLHTPVLVSKHAALPETTMGLLNYYEPATDCHVLAIKILELLRCPPDLGQRVDIAQRYLHQYDESLIAAKYLSQFEAYLQSVSSSVIPS